jgi:hypothetical protein
MYYFVSGLALEHEGSCADQYWIGAVDPMENGNYQWMDGTPFTYTNWNSSNND